MTPARTVARAAGRINLIGEHTDYTGGLAMPMAIDRGTTVAVAHGGDRVQLVSDHHPEPAVVSLDVVDPQSIQPSWARYVAGVIVELRPDIGASGSVSSDLPIGAGVSSSASLQIAVALALGFQGRGLELAQLCRRAEHRASGVPCGIMDQLGIVSGAEGAAVLIDCTTLAVETAALPPGLSILGVHSGESRELAASAYSQRHDECMAAEAVVGPLRQASPADIARIPDPVLRRRARHVVSENQRVTAFRQALQQDDLVTAGHLVDASHESLRDDYQVSTPAVDDLVESLRCVPGVYGARMTGAGFGGMVIALCAADAVLPRWLAGSRFRPSDGTEVVCTDGSGQR